LVAHVQSPVRRQPRIPGTYEELLVLLPFEDLLNIDETGHKENGRLWWTWCLRADLYTIYKIDARRSADVLLDLLGADFDGVIGCDYFSAYRRYMRVMGVEMQFCLAHLIRDVKFLTTLPDACDRAYGERLRQAGYGPITTEIAPAGPFYYAEDHHQQYLEKNPWGYCGLGGTGVSCPVGLNVAGSSAG